VVVFQGFGSSDLMMHLMMHHMMLSMMLGTYDAQACSLNVLHKASFPLKSIIAL